MLINLIDAVSYNEDRILGKLEVTRGGETKLYAYLFPKDTMEWRAAEYGFDPASDMELLLDIVIYEPFVSIPEGSRLYDAPTRGEARRVMLAAVMAVKDESDKERGEKPPAPALRSQIASGREKVLALSFMDLDVLEVKRGYVSRQRKAYEKPKEIKTMSRMDKVKLQLEVGRGGNTDV